MTTKKILIVGAGVSGATVARLLSDYAVDNQLHFDMTIIDKRSHVAGNCHTAISHGIMEHVYGPHIFHTDQPEVFSFVKKFSNFYNYRHTVKAMHDGVYSLPINLLTICQVYGKELSPKQAIDLIGSVRLDIKQPQNFEEQALSMVGDELYKKFFKAYTERQWGVKATEIPAYILKRLPLRFNFDDSYFNHPVQAMPFDGYTAMVEKMLDAKGVKIKLQTDFDKKMLSHYDNIFYTGKLDEFYDFQYGDLPYRTLEFQKEFFSDTDYQGCAVMNNCSPKGDYTRITEYKYFLPDKLHKDTIIAHEYSKDAKRDDIPYYPVNLVSGNQILDKYQGLAKKEDKVIFLGRLGRFQYLDMDKAILAAMECGKNFLQE
ncbi:MAG: UDP-galactopyranose/dTDP-fucopyranose mutase family protein [Gammaproteobacteria bacterium]